MALNFKPVTVPHIASKSIRAVISAKVYHLRFILKLLNGLKITGSNGSNLDLDLINVF